VSVKIGLISDVHAMATPLQQALTLLAQEQVDTILCAGDIAGYGRELEQTVALLRASDCRCIFGNHDLWQLSRADIEIPEEVAGYLRGLPRVVELAVEGQRLAMVHASPPESLMDGIRLLDEDAEPIPELLAYWHERLRSFPFDVLVVGHTHQVFVQQLGHLMVINPGSTLFNHTCAVLSLPDLSVRILPLGGKEPLLAWNWGRGGFGAE